MLFQFMAPHVLPGWCDSVSKAVFPCANQSFSFLVKTGLAVRRAEVTRGCDYPLVSFRFSLFISSFKTSLVADQFYVKLKFYYCRTVGDEKFGIISKILTTKCYLLVILPVESYKHSEKVISNVSTGKMFKFVCFTHLIMSDS